MCYKIIWMSYSFIQQIFNTCYVLGTVLVSTVTIVNITNPIM
jgi:hypothetical protein